jgi:hypothetical protein
VSETEAARHLRLFAERNGFAVELLSGNDPYWIEGADAAFDGRVEVIRLTEHGRFGNIFYQILHAVLLARQLGVATVALFPFTGGPPVGRHLVDGLTFDVGPASRSAAPTLVGHFFNSYVFQSALTGYRAEALMAAVDRVMRPLFAHLSSDGQAGDLDTAVLNLRGGDVFAGRELPGWYVQPPVSYYIRAALFAREAHGVSKVVIVSEDDRNPAVGIAAQALEHAGMAVSRHSVGFAEDIRLLLNASHLVTPFGTLCEALGMLSTHLRSYTAFRQFESHRHLHMRRASMPLSVLRAHGVTPVRIIDRGLSYIPLLSWDRSEEQLDLLRRFPMDRLHVDIPDDDADDACFAAFTPSGVTSAATEAYGLRRALVSLHAHRDTELRSAAEALSVAQAARSRAETETRSVRMEMQAAVQSAQQTAWQDVTVARAEFSRVAAERAAIHCSLSWRVTAPLRRISGALRGTLRKWRPQS